MSDNTPAESAPEAPVSEPQTETTSLPEPENAEPPAPEAEPEAPFEPKVGDLVEAKWKGGKEWFPAKITAWYPPKTKARDPHYDVEHEDGATQEQLRVDEIRALAPAVAADVAFRPPAPTYFLEGSPRPKGRARRVAVRLNGAIVDAATLPAPPRPSPTSPSPRKRRRAAADPLDVLADFLAARGGDPARLEGFEAKHVDVTEHVTRVEYVGPDRRPAAATIFERFRVGNIVTDVLGRSRRRDVQEPRAGRARARRRPRRRLGRHLLGRRLRGLVSGAGGVAQAQRGKGQGRVLRRPRRVAAARGGAPRRRREAGAEQARGLAAHGRDGGRRRRAPRLRALSTAERRRRAARPRPILSATSSPEHG